MGISLRSAAILYFLATGVAEAQPPMPASSFDVASVKPVDPARVARGGGGLRGGPGTASPGRVTGSPSLMDLLLKA